MAKEMSDKEYLEYRKQLFEETVLDMVEHICEELINDPEGVEVFYEVHDRDARLKINVPKGYLKFIKGKKNEYLASIKKLAYAVANIHNFYLALDIQERD